MAKLREFQTAFDTFTMVSVKGEGGPGRVYVVTDGSGKEFALKTLKPEAVTKSRLKRFRSEILFCLKVDHPNIVPVLDYGTSIENEAPVPFYVMPLFDRTLRADIPFKDPAQALKVFAQILSGVEAAHLNKVWHRDLKPENILISTDAVVADFGIAHFSEPVLRDAIKTQDKERLANFIYAAPEQRQRGVSDQRADLFALGLLLNEMITGEVPLGTKFRTIGSVHDSHAYLDEIVDKLISQKPEDRIQSVRELKREVSARATEFFSAQELRGAEKAIVPEYTPDHVPDFGIVGVDLVAGNLVLELDGIPPPDWVSFLNQGHFGHSSVMGHGPETFQISGSRVTASHVANHLVQDVIDRFKDWIPIVSAEIQRKRKQQAEALKREAEERVRKEIREKRDRLDTLRKLKF